MSETELPTLEVEALDDKPGTVYLWHIPDEWSSEQVDDLGEAIGPQFDAAVHIFAEEGMTIEDVTEKVEIVETIDE